IVRDSKGRVLNTEDIAPEREPGQAAYEDLTGGRNWDNLTEEEKNRYAEMEKKLEGTDVLETARENATANDMISRDAERDETDRELTNADDVLSRKPAADKVPAPNRLMTDEESREASLALKGLEWVLSLPDAKLKSIQEELNKAIKDDPALVQELMSTERRDLIGFLNRHPKIMKNWEEKVKPTLTAGTSAISAGLSITKAIDQVNEGKYSEALQSFLEAGASGLKAIPPGELAKIQEELGRSPAPIALAVKDLIGFGHEAFRDTKGKPRNWGKLLKDGIGMVNNLYQSLPDEQRKHFIERQFGFLRNGLKKVEEKTPGAKAVMGLIDAAPEVWNLFSEWNTGKRWVNISNLAQKLGPKVVGALVKASTGSDAAAEVVETVVQLGADYMGHLGAQAREATEAAMKQAGAESMSYARMRNELNRMAIAAGMTSKDAHDYEFLSNIVSGHYGYITLGDMRRNENLMGVREAMQAWRRVSAATGRDAAAVKGFFNSLTDHKSRASGDEDAYQSWLQGRIYNARLAIAEINRILPEYARGSGSHKFLSAWRQDLQHMVKRFGR
ncbi:MAG: hypothetical protein JSV50_08940, partial [Desulfobacteraceae bacterium]